jgi:hypothetical protein
MTTHYININNRMRAIEIDDTLTEDTIRMSQKTFDNYLGGE